MKRRSGGRISEDETGATWGDTGSGTMDPVGTVVVGRWGGGSRQNKTPTRRTHEATHMKTIQAQCIP